MAQEYRLNLWPTPKPAEQLEVKQRVVLYYANERLPDDNPCFKLRIGPLPEPAKPVLPPDGEQDHPPGELTEQADTNE